MISRRGFFGLLAGAALSPYLAPVMKYFPDSKVAAQTYYTKEMLANLKRQMELRHMVIWRSLPSESGKVIQFYAYQLKEEP